MSEMPDIAIGSRTPQPVERFSDVSLSTLPWQSEKSTEPAPSESVLRALVPIDIEGKRFTLSARIHSSHNAHGEPTNATVTFCIPNSRDAQSEPFINLAFVMGSRENRSFISVHDDITRGDVDNNPLPRGFGMQLYEKGLEFLETLHTSKPMHHEVVPAPDDDDMDKWNQRFVPVLQRHGYGKAQNGSWEKVYAHADQVM